MEQLRKGVDIGGYVTRPAKVKILKTDEEKDISRLEIVIHEGKNRQVRRMCESIGKKVLALHRSKIGNISVKDLPLGQWRYLEKGANGDCSFLSLRSVPECPKGTKKNRP